MVFARGTRWFAGAVIVACLALVGPSGPSGALFARALPSDAVKDVVANRVMTWNLCNPCGRDNADRAAQIAAYAPQVVGLQEACVRDVERIRDDLRIFYGLRYHVAYGSVLRNWGRCGGAPWSPGGYGQAILSAAPMTDRVSTEYPEGGSEARGYLAVTTRLDGRPVRVFDTHLAERSQQAVRADQAAVLAAEVIRYDRAVVLGDFNAVPRSDELTPLWDAASEADPRCRPGSADACAPTTDWRLKFDYVFLRGVRPVGQRVRPTAYSDHHVLYADLDLPVRSATAGGNPAAGAASGGTETNRRFLR